MPKPDRKDIREILALRLKLSAALHCEMGAALVGKDQAELSRHFLQTAELMLEASRELNQ